MPNAQTLPWSWYTDPAILQAEQLRVFRGAWHYVGHTGMFPAQAAALPIDVNGVPVVVTRDSADTFHALVNVCRHRGSIVCPSAAAGETLQCPYHAWTYDLDGSLRNAPRSDREPDFDPSTHALSPIGLGRWGPFLFVAVEPDASFEEWIGDVPERVAEVVDVDALRFWRRTESDYRGNWKVCVENFLECYHCRVAHPAFSRVIDTGPDDYRLITSPTGSTQYGPVRPGWTGTFDPSGPVGRGQFHVIHPATAINIMPGRQNLSIGPVIPTSPGTTHRFLDYFFGPDADDGWIESMLAFDDQVGAEDLPLVESVHRGMEAATHDHGTLFLDSERLVAHFGEWIRTRIAAMPAGESAGIGDEDAQTRTGSGSDSTAVGT